MDSRPKRRRKADGCETGTAAAAPSAQLSAELLQIPMGTETALHRILDPIDPKEFLQSYWEKKPLFISRENPQHYQDLYAMDDFWELLRTKILNFGNHINCSRFNGTKKIFTNPGSSPIRGAYANGADNEVDSGETQVRATVDNVRALWNCGSTVQFLQPQQHCEKLARLVGQLEQFFGCLVGVNAYMTPADSQGLAPHHDDIEAFVLQIEGRKEWRIYEPLEQLPRSCSGDLLESKLGPPFQVVELWPGDMLYFPRGWIHQAKTVGGSGGAVQQCQQHSVHLTVSTYQGQCWGDLLGTAVQLATDECIELRRGLPIALLQFAGLAYSGSETNTERRTGPADDKNGSKLQANRNRADKFSHDWRDKRLALSDQVRGLLSSDAVVNAIVRSLDRAVDHHAVDFIASRLPPHSFASVNNHNAAATGGKLSADAAVQHSEASRLSTGEVGPQYVRWVDPAGTRLVVEQPLRPYHFAQVHVDENTAAGGTLALYHSSRNNPADHMGDGKFLADSAEEDSDDETRVDSEPGLLRFSRTMLPALQALYQGWPKPVSVHELVSKCSDKSVSEDDGVEAACCAMLRGLQVEGLLEICL